MKHLLIFCALVFSSPLFAQNFMFRGNPAHTGVYPGPAPAQFSRIKWQFHTDAQVLSSPVIESGVLYIGSSDHYLYGLDAESGSLKWKFKTGGRISSSPAVASGLVFFGSYDSIFHAVDAATGALSWKFQTAGERRFAATHLHGGEPAAETMPDPFDFFLSSPVVADGLVYFGSGDTNIYALDATSGALKWKFKTADVVHASPALSGGTLYIGSWDSYFYALDSTTGALKWRFKTGEDPKFHNQVGIQSSAAVSDGVVYFGCRDSKFYAVDAASGKLLWAFPNSGSWVISSPAVHQGTVYFATSDSGLFHALDAKSGTSLFSLENHHWPMFSSPAISGDTVFIGSHEGKLLAIDVKSRKVAWTFQTEASKQNGPTYTKLDGSPNYQAAFFDFFYDDMVSGVQKMMSVGAILSSPVIANGTLYFAAADGNVYALI